MSLTPEQFRRADGLFRDCVQRAPLERDAHLARACPDDAAVREFVLALLLHDESPGLPPTAQVKRDLHDQARALLTPDEGDPKQIGAYRIIEKLGEGGFGAVYLAEQEQPVRRRVAIKIIKLGMDTRQIVARFELERQALALMDHPGIAKVFDAGATPSGRPYFVMELVRGEPITHYCDAHRLTTSDRARLFIDVCRAVQHAHHKGVIHRDLKPSNILVTEQDGRPAPKIIDFGIAKAISQPLTDASIQTHHQQIVGTPTYMSPEQADSGGRDVDTRTDVYSLGVVLYELLVGAIPFGEFGIAPGNVDSLRRLIREQEPLRPSVRLITPTSARVASDSAKTAPAAGVKSGSETARLVGKSYANDVAARRGTDPAALRRQLRGELDWITLRAMEKDRTRRYESPAALAADLERYLRNESVMAGPPTPGYRFRKFVRRHRALFAVTGVVLVALVGGLVAATWGLWTARQERDRAGAEAAKARAVSQFLEDLFASITPMNALGREVTVREVFDQADRRIGTELAKQPEVEAAVRFTIGQTYRALGRAHEAEQQYRATLALRERVLGADHDATLEAKAALGSLLSSWGSETEARLLLKDVLARRERRGLSDDATTATLLTELGRIRGNLDEREPLLRRGYELRQRLLPPDHPDIGHSLIELAYIAASRMKYDEAIDMVTRALEIHRKAYQSPHPQVAATLYCKGDLLLDAHRPAEAVPAYREAAEQYRRVFPENQASMARSLNALGVALMDLHKFEEAAATFRDALACESKSIIDSPTLFASFRGNYGDCLRMMRRFDEAEPILLNVLAVETTNRTDPEDMALARERLELLYRDWGKPERAQAYAESAPQTQPTEP